MIGEGWHQNEREQICAHEQQHEKCYKKVQHHVQITSLTIPVTEKTSSNIQRQFHIK